jgi:hypothetical protein
MHQLPQDRSTAAYQLRPGEAIIRFINLTLAIIDLTDERAALVLAAPQAERMRLLTWLAREDEENDRNCRHAKEDACPLTTDHPPLTTDH